MAELQIKQKKICNNPTIVEHLLFNSSERKGYEPILNRRLCVKHLEPNLADLQGKSTSGQTAATNGSLRTSRVAQNIS